MQGMALQDSPNGESDTLHGSILLQRLESVNRTGWNKPTTMGKEGREYVLIYLYNPYDYSMHIVSYPLTKA
jgi:hypothetical protein